MCWVGVDSDGSDGTAQAGHGRAKEDIAGRTRQSQDACYTGGKLFAMLFVGCTQICL